MIRHVPWFLRQAVLHAKGQSRAKRSSGLSAFVQCSEPTEKSTEQKVGGNEGTGAVGSTTSYSRTTGSMVAAAFASLKEDSDTSDHEKRKRSSVDAQIVRADSVEAILTIAELPSISRHHALRIISVLSDWSASGRVKLADFEGDVRFIKLCRILGKSVHPHKSGGPSFGDLATVLGVTGDEEAAKLVAGISLHQMIKVMSTLAQKRRRSTPLLRSLAFNIGRQEERLNMKQCADLLYAASVLNFPDDLLLDKVCGDLCESVPTNTKSAVMRSVVTSLGLLRYKHAEVLDVVSEWAATNADNCRSQDLSSLILTLATLNYTPFNANVLFQAVEQQVNVRKLVDPAAWLDYVWSLFVLDRGSSQHAESVLSSQFLTKLVKGGTQNIGTAAKLKLLNINACSKLKLSQYNGAMLPEDSDVHNVPLTRSQDKSLLTAAIFDSLSNLLSSSTYLRTDINTGMGFILDGECVLDENCNPMPIEAVSTAYVKPGKKKTRIGIMSLGYHDLCRGTLNHPTGVSALALQLLHKNGYKVLVVPHTDFNPHDKLVRRVQYLEQQLKRIVRSA